MIETTNQRHYTLALVIVVLLCFGMSAVAKKKKLKPEELVHLHLQSLGTGENEAARTNCQADGNGALTILRGGGGVLSGPAKFLSDGRKLRMSILFNRSDYPAEEVAFDGNEVDVSQMSPGRRSPLGEFLYQYDEIVTEGLFGGALSTGWPLLEVEEREPKLKYEGLKKVDDVEYHTLRYRPRKRSDLQIRIYFDPQTHRHLMTIYKVRIEPFGGRTMDERALQAVVRYDVREKFEEFREVGDLLLPARWIVDYTREMGTNIDMLRWTMDFQKIESDSDLNPSFFRLY
jgi:hypothetical protein